MSYNQPCGKSLLLLFVQIQMAFPSTPRQCSPTVVTKLFTAFKNHLIEPEQRWKTTAIITTASSTKGLQLLLRLRYLWSVCLWAPHRPDISTVRNLVCSSCKRADHFTKVYPKRITSYSMHLTVFSSKSKPLSESNVTGVNDKLASSEPLKLVLN